MSSRTIDNTDGILNYGGDFWTLDGTWRARDGSSGTLSSSNALNARVSFTFPVAANGFSFYGIKRSNGGRYEICFDCSDSGPFDVIDAYDRSDDGQNPPIVLYSRTWPSNGRHSVILRNSADSRGVYTNGQTGNSQITLDRFVLSIAADPPRPPSSISTPLPPTSIPRNQPTSSSTSSTTPNDPTSTPGNADSSTTGGSSSASSRVTSAPNGSNTATGDGVPAPFTSGSSSTTTLPGQGNSLGTDIAVNGGNIDSESKTPLGAILGGVFGALAIIAMIILFCFWRRRRQRIAKPEPITLPDPDNDPTNPFNQLTARSPTPTGTTSPEVTSIPSAGLTPAATYAASTEKERYLREWSPDGQLYTPSASSPSHTRSQPSFSTTFTSSASESGPFSSGISNSGISSADSQMGQAGTSRSVSIYSSTSSQARLAPNRRVEVDAGPLPLRLVHSDEDDLESLPPDYGDIFGSRHTSRSRSVAGRSVPASLPPAFEPVPELPTEKPPLPQ
ncbi:hypothetical protein BJ165DRAFT_389970 [Panaeolus papilionaceus]|nr:hypothetical protein BJ165DRAFT_389970 [Panaeolus papilionaceus]